MKSLVLAMLFALGSCAHPVAGPSSSLSKLAVNAGDGPPAIHCEASKPCVVHYRLNAPVNGQSVETAIAWLDMAEREEATVFVLEINTPGGNVFAGFELAKRIERSKVPVACVVDGMAASMGFYLLQSCPVRAMTRRSVLMTHEPSISADVSGPPNEWKSVAETLRALRDAMAWYCNRRLTTTLEEYHARTDGGLTWWFTFVDAKKYHAVDVAVDSVEEVIEELSKPGA